MPGLFGLGRAIQDAIGITGDVEVVQPTPADLNMTMFRDHEVLTATIPNAGSFSNEIDVHSWAGGNVYLPAGWTAAEIGFYVCHTTGGTFLPLYDELGTLLEIAGVAVSQAYRIPAEVFATGFMQIWSETAGVSTPQGAERIIQVEFKS